MASARPVPLIAVCFLALSNAAKECGNADRLTALSLSTSHLAMFSELSFYVPLMSLITQFPGSFSSPIPAWLVSPYESSLFRAAPAWCTRLTLSFLPCCCPPHLFRGCTGPFPLQASCACWSLSRVRLSCDPMDCNPPGSSVLPVLQAGILEWVAINRSKTHHLPFPV